MEFVISAYCHEQRQCRGASGRTGSQGDGGVLKSKWRKRKIESWLSEEVETKEHRAIVSDLVCPPLIVNDLICPLLIV